MPAICSSSDLGGRLPGDEAARITQAEAELASATAGKENVLDLRAALAQMTDIAQEVLGEEADQGSLRDFYLALRLRVDYDPSTRIASATAALDGNGGEASVSEGDIDASPTNYWYDTDPLLGHNTNALAEGEAIRGDSVVDRPGPRHVEGRLELDPRPRSRAPVAPREWPGRASRSGLSQCGRSLRPARGRPRGSASGQLMAAGTGVAVTDAANHAMGGSRGRVPIHALGSSWGAVDGVRAGVLVLRY